MFPRKQCKKNFKLTFTCSQTLPNESQDKFFLLVKKRDNFNPRLHEDSRVAKEGKSLDQRELKQ